MDDNITFDIGDIETAEWVLDELIRGASDCYRVGNAEAARYAEQLRNVIAKKKAE